MASLTDSDDIDDWDQDKEEERRNEEHDKRRLHEEKERARHLKRMQNPPKKFKPIAPLVRKMKLDLSICKEQFRQMRNERDQLKKIITKLKSGSRSSTKKKRRKGRKKVTRRKKTINRK